MQNTRKLFFSDEEMSFILPLNPEHFRIRFPQKIEEKMLLSGFRLSSAGAMAATAELHFSLPRDSRYSTNEGTKTGAGDIFLWLKRKKDNGEVICFSAGETAAMHCLIENLSLELREGDSDLHIGIALRETEKTAEKQTVSVKKDETKTTYHTVGDGDSLWALAKRYLGDGNRWPEIYEANREIIGDDPNLIINGTVLIIPGG